MPKHNQFIKNIKSQFVSINNTLESYFNELKFFIKNFRRSKFSKNNKAFLILIGITFLVISYYLLPTLYNKDLIQLEIKNQIYKKYNINIKFNEKVKYGLLPKPHFVAKNLSVILENKEIALVNTFKVNLKAKNFFSFNHVELKDLTFNKAIFNIYSEDLVFF